MKKIRKQPHDPDSGKQQRIKTPAPVRSGRSAQAKTNTGAVSGQESKLGGHRKNAAGGRAHVMPYEEKGSREADLSASDHRADVG